MEKVSFVQGLFGTLGLALTAVLGYLGVRATARSTARAAQPSMEAAVTANLMLLLNERNAERERLRAEILQIKAECDARAEKAEQISTKADQRSAAAERRLEEVERFLNDCQRKLAQFQRRPGTRTRTYDQSQEDEGE